MVSQMHLNIMFKHTLPVLLLKTLPILKIPLTPLSLSIKEISRAFHWHQHAILNLSALWISPWWLGYATTAWKMLVPLTGLSALWAPLSPQ
jgi:hypothetical protein